MAGSKATAPASGRDQADAPVKNNRSLPDRIAEVRGRIEVIRERIAAIDDDQVPVPLDSALADVEQYVWQIGQEAAPRHVFGFCFPGRRKDPFCISHDQAEKLPGLLAWLIPERMIERLQALVRAEYEHLPEPVPADQRELRVARLRDELFDAEKLDFDLTNQAIESGFAIAQRGDVDPAILLGLDR